MTDSPLPQPGWYPDPSGTPGLRWWDGASWSEHTHQGASAVATEVLPRPAVPEYAPEPPAAPAPRGRWKPIGLVALLLVVAVLGVVGLIASLTAPKLNTATVEQQIAQQIADQLSVSATVTCPDRVDLVKGGTFTCQVKTEDGRSATIKVTQVDDNGLVEWDTVASQ